MGKYLKGNNRPRLVKFTRDKKRQIFQQTKVLKNTKTWIDEDYSKGTLEERRQLLPFLKESRQKGKRAKLKNNKLIINEGMYTVQVLPLEKQKLQIDKYNKRTVSGRKLLWPDKENYKNNRPGILGDGERDENNMDQNGERKDDELVVTQAKAKHKKNYKKGTHSKREQQKIRNWNNRRIDKYNVQILEVSETKKMATKN